MTSIQPGQFPRGFAGENCLIDQHGYLKIIDFGVAERITSGRIYAVPDLGLKWNVLESLHVKKCFFNGRVPQKMADADDMFSFCCTRPPSNKRIKSDRVLIGASSTVVTKFVKDQAVFHHSFGPGQGNSTLHGTRGQ